MANAAVHNTETPSCPSARTYAEPPHIYWTEWGITTSWWTFTATPRLTLPTISRFGSPRHAIPKSDSAQLRRICHDGGRVTRITGFLSPKERLKGVKPVPRGRAWSKLCSRSPPKSPKSNARYAAGARRSVWTPCLVYLWRLLLTIPGRKVLVLPDLAAASTMSTALECTTVQ